MSRSQLPGAVHARLVAPAARPAQLADMSATPTNVRRTNRDRPIRPGRPGLWAAGWLAAGLALAGLTARAALSVTTPTGMPVGRTVTAEQLWEELDRTLPDNVWVSPLQNPAYEVISAKWLRRSFLPALKRQMASLEKTITPADDSAANCGGYALMCRLMLGLSAMAAQGRAPATATLIVQQGKPFGGLPATKENHCVAYVLTDEGPWIIEVQTGTHVPAADYPNLATIKLVSVH